MKNENGKKMKLQFKGKALLAISKGAENMHRVGIDAKVPHTTMHKYMSKPERMKNINLDTLMKILIDGLQLNENDLQDLKFLDVFELIDQE